MGHENWTVESPTFRGHPRILQIIQGSWMSSTLELTQFCDGSAYLSHMERIRGARGQALDESIYTTPLMYQGVSDKFLIWCAMIHAFPYEYKTDFEAEVGVVIDDVPMGIKVDNTSVGQLGVHISQSSEVSQRSDENSNSASNRPLQRVRKGYRLSSKCWD